jgi:DNA-binding NarL/FixJ family response regulator
VRRQGPIRVLVVEDYTVMAEGLRSLLATQPDLEVVGCAGTVAEAVKLTAETSPDVVLADYRLPDGTGADVALALRERRPRTAVVFLSAVDTVATLLAAVEAGAKGYLLKSRAPGEVFDAVRRAAAGEMLIPASVLAELLPHRGEQAILLATLTPREREILKLMAEGLDNKAIAQRLGIRYGTVRSHVRSVIGKLNAHSKMEAVVRAEDLGLVER